MLETKVCKLSNTSAKNIAYRVISTIEMLALHMFSTPSLVSYTHEEQMGFTLLFTNSIMPINVEDAQPNTALNKVPLS